MRIEVLRVLLELGLSPMLVARPPLAAFVAAELAQLAVRL